MDVGFCGRNESVYEYKEEEGGEEEERKFYYDVARSSTQVCRTDKRRMFMFPGITVYFIGRGSVGSCLGPIGLLIDCLC